MVQKAKAEKRPGCRVLVNTGLLTLMAIVFAVVTGLGIWQLKTYQNSLTSDTVSDGPSLCYRNQTIEMDSSERTLERAYICSTEPDDGDYQSGDIINMTELNSDKDYTLFLFGRNTFYTVSIFYAFEIVLFAVGSMLTLASLMGALIYYIHNRGN